MKASEGAQCLGKNIMHLWELNVPETSGHSGENVTHGLDTGESHHTNFKRVPLTFCRQKQANKVISRENFGAKATIEACGHNI